LHQEAAMITAREADGPLGRLRVEKTWAEIWLDGLDAPARYQLTLLSATLNGDLVTWPRSQQIVEAYMAGQPDFRAWMERTEP
jgi:hypothetical protein